MMKKSVLNRRNKYLAAVLTSALVATSALATNDEPDGSLSGAASLTGTPTSSGTASPGVESPRETFTSFGDSPVASDTASPRTVTPSMNNDNNTPAPQDDIPASILKDLHQLHLNQTGIALSEGFLLEEKQKTSYQGLVAITDLINEQLREQVAIANLRGKLGEYTLSWIMLKDLSLGQVLSLCIEMTTTEKSSSKKIDAITRGAFTAIKWTDWKRELRAKFIEPVAQITKLTPIALDDDALENAVVEYYSDLASFIDKLKGFSIVCAHEEVKPTKPAAAEKPSLIEFLRELSSDEDILKAKVTAIIAKNSKNLYENLLKACFVGAEEYLAQQERHHGLCAAELMHMMLVAKSK